MMCINPTKSEGPLRSRNGSTTTAATTTNNRHTSNNNNSHGNRHGIHHEKRNINYQANKSSTTTALRRMAPLILSGYTFNTVAYFAIVYAPSWSSGATFAPYPEFCPMTATENEQSNYSNITNCTRRDLFAFQAVSFFNLSYLGLFGSYTFFFSKRRGVWWSQTSGASSSSSFSSSESLPPTPTGRYFGKLSEADLINAGIVIFQGWDFVASLFFEEHCTVVMMMHHLLAFMCGFFCLMYEVAPYYAVYFGGVSEFSSIFLCLAQIFDFYPPSSLMSPDSIISSTLPGIVTFSRAMFVVTFFAFRIVGWAIMAHKFISDGSFIIKNRLCLVHSPGSKWFLRYLLTTSVLLGALLVERNR